MISDIDKPGERWLDNFDVAWAALRLRAVAVGDVPPREDEPVDLLVLLSLRLTKEGTMETFNQFGVGSIGDDIAILVLPNRRISKEAALNLAAWLVSIADPGGQRFAEALAMVQRS